MTESEKTPASDMESAGGSDDEETVRKKPRTSMDEDETNVQNIWRKRRKYSSILQMEMTNVEQKSSPIISPERHSSNPKQDYLRSNSNEYDKYSTQIPPPRRPHDHQVPNFIPTYPEDPLAANRSVTFSSFEK